MIDFPEALRRMHEPAEPGSERALLTAVWNAIADDVLDDDVWAECTCVVFTGNPKRELGL